MNAERLLEVYEQISEAPDAIARLRRFVLDLAVRGKLVEQDAGDEPAAELLKQIAAEKAAANASGKKRSRKSASSTDKCDGPAFSLPASWQWTSLAEISHQIHYGYTASAAQQEKEHRLLRITDIQNDGVDWDAVPGCIIDEATLAKYELKPNDLLIARTGGTIGKTFLVDTAPVKSVFASYLIRVQPASALYAKYVKLFCGSDIYWDQLREGSRGGGQPNVNGQTLGGLKMPLPPLAEQHRIVAKVDELMALCDRLEEVRKTQEEVRDKLTAASLARLTAPDTTPEDFPTHAAFALEALPALTTRPDQIKTLRQTILNLAVRGKLVEQDPVDEPASQVLARMIKQRKDIVASRKIRGSTPPKSPSAETEGFTLPFSWELCALGQITLITDPNPSHRYPDYAGGTVPILSTREFSGEGGWNPETAKLTTQAFWEFQKEICDFAEGDIIFARKGRLGLPRFLPSFEKFTFSHTLFSIKPMTGLDPNYLLWLLRRDEVVAWLTNEMNQNTGVPTLGKAKTERLPIPLPPLAEQHRIVAKVDALMTLCDQLEAALITADITRTRLLEALLHEALEPGAPIQEAAERRSHPRARNACLWPATALLQNLNSTT